MTPFSRPTVSNRPPHGDGLPAIAVGALLAFACWVLALHADPQVADAGHVGVLALVMVTAGAASFVLFALHADSEGRPSGATAAGPVARRLILLLGMSFSASMYLLNACVAG